MFDPTQVNLHTLRKRAHNLRWAAVPSDTIPLTAADPDFPCPPPEIEAIHRFLKEGYFSYAPATGITEFKESMAGFFNEKRKVPANPDYILPVDSAAFGIYITCKTFLAPGDEAIIFDPVDYLFRYSVEAVDAKAVTLPIPQGANADFERINDLITPKTKMICLCNPLNPTGKVFTRAELEQLGHIAEKHNLIILSDEIWSDIIFTPHHFTSIASLNKEIRNRTITITGFSKSYGLAGLRIGAILASNAQHFEEIFAASRHQSTVHGANIISQIAATAALDECGPWLEQFVTHLQSMRDLTVTRLNEIPGFTCRSPEGCYVAFVNITGTGHSSAAIKDFLLEKAKVAVVPGLPEWFGAGAEGHIRLSFATSKEILLDACNRITLTIPNL
jgi:aminotransferase